MHKRLIITILALGVVVALVAIGCGSSGTETTSTTSSFSEGTITTLAGGEGLDGKVLFEDNCARCHRRDLNGDVGPILRGYIARDIGGLEIQILNGGGDMPAFRGVLEDGEVAAIANYIVGVGD